MKSDSLRKLGRGYGGGEEPYRAICVRFCKNAMAGFFSGEIGQEAKIALEIY